MASGYDRCGSFSSRLRRLRARLVLAYDVARVRSLYELVLPTR